VAVIGRRRDGSTLEKRLTKRTSYLHLYNEDLVTVDLAALAAAPELSELALDGNPIDELDLASLPRSCPKLVSLSVPSRLPLDIRPLAALTSLKRLTLKCEELPALDLSLLADLPLESLNVYGGRFDTLDLSPLARCGTLEQFQVERAAIRRIDLSPLAGLTRMESLYVQSNPALDVVDLAVCARWPRLQRLHVTGSPITKLDLAPLSACQNLAFLILVGLRLTELDVTPLAALPALKQLRVDPDGRDRPALALGIAREAVTAPVIREYLGLGAITRAGVPPHLLRTLLWAFGGGPWESKQALSEAIRTYLETIRGDAGTWNPEARVLAVPRVEIVYEDLASDEDPAVTSIASDGGGDLTALDLMWGLEQAFGEHIGGRDTHFFEGLALRLKTAWDPVPRYDLRLGS
jgi:hypothetical protein